MKVVLVVIAALVTLGLAAVGVVAAQKSTFSSQPTERVARAAAADPVKSVPPAAPARLSPIRDADMPAVMMAAPPATTAPAAATTAPALPAAASAAPSPTPPAPSVPQRVAENTAKPAAANANAGPPAAAGIGACDKPGGMGLARIVEIDTTGGPGFGFEQFKAYDFLRDHEVVLTFDDGPWPGNTPAVLKALADQCTKALFFPIGKHASWHPEILKQVAAAGHSIGSHTWSHKDLSKLSEQDAFDEIEKGIAAVSIALNDKSPAAFFRFPALRSPEPLLKYVGTRNLGLFSTDLDSFDFKIHKPDQVIKSVMTKLNKRAKGIILMHDFQQSTAHALPELLRQLKESGYQIVQVVGKQPVVPKPEYVQMVLKEVGGGMAEARPVASVVRTISESSSAATAIGYFQR